MATNQVIDEIYRTRVVHDESGNQYDLSAEVDGTEGDYLYRLISSDDSITKTVEVDKKHHKALIGSGGMYWSL